MFSALKCVCMYVCMFVYSTLKSFSSVFRFSFLSAGQEKIDKLKIASCVLTLHTFTMLFRIGITPVMG